jgi:hypothetical protein
MSPAARAALPYFLGKPKAPFNRPDYYTVDFSFSYLEARRYGFARATFAKIIEQVMAHGFIDPIQKGGLRGFSKSCSTFRLSRRWEKFGSAEFSSVSWKEYGA